MKMSHLKTYVPECWCHTQMQLVQYSFTWAIDNFKFRPEKVGEVLKSSIFPTGTDDKHKWRLCLYPRGLPQSEGFVSLFVELISKHETEVRAVHEFSIINEKLEKTNSKMSDGAGEFVEGHQSGFEKYILRNSLWKEKEKLLVNDKLTIHCKIVVVGDTFNTFNSSLAEILRPEPNARPESIFKPELTPRPESLFRPRSGTKN